MKTWRANEGRAREWRANRLKANGGGGIRRGKGKEERASEKGGLVRRRVTGKR